MRQRIRDSSSASAAKCRKRHRMSTRVALGMSGDAALVTAAAAPPAVMALLAYVGGAEGGDEETKGRSIGLAGGRIVPAIS